ncbi:MAG: Squalene/phytoene synthase [Betaproteobacteria bacterium]|nr:Squalene/phytoene synthase [Betaproteobacteria bacterium]
MSVGHYENFPVASIILPRRLREPIAAIYHFARGADDIADEGDAGDAERIAGLEAYRAQLRLAAAGEPPAPQPEAMMFTRLGDVIRHYNLPVQLFEDLLDAFAQDVVKKRYADFPEVLDYCRRSANPVGRLLLHLYGKADAENLRRSDCICSALQLINFWQDIAVDWQKERVYLPQDSLVRFGASEADIAQSKLTPQFLAMMKFEVARARAMLRDGAPLVHALPGRMGIELRMVVQGGLRILEKIEAVHYDMFRHRPILKAWDWALMAGRAITM